MLLKVGVQERVGCPLGYQRLVVRGVTGAMISAPSDPSSRKPAPAGTQVLHVDNGVPSGAERLEDLTGLGGRCLRLV